MKLHKYHQSRLAVGSDCTLCLVTDSSETEANQLFDSLWKVIFQFERRFSRFIPNSELSVFNRSAGLDITISPEFKSILQVAKQLSLKTGGLYNPFILPALQSAGYIQSRVPANKHDPQEDYSNRKVVDIHNLKIGDTTASIPYGTALDLGGCGKGYLADLLANVDLPKSIKGFWYSIGGDVTGQGIDVDGRPWTVVIDGGQNQPTDQVGYIHPTKRRFAAATSATTIRRGTHKGKHWHHIIDPRNLQPADSDCYMATVFGKSAVEADVLSSCAIILGSNQSQSFLENLGIKDGLLKCYSPKIGNFIIHFGSAINIDDTKSLNYNHANA